MPKSAYGNSGGRLTGMDIEHLSLLNENSDIYDTPLARQDGEMWLNSILWRLAVALGYASVGDQTVILDPDELLELAEDVIWRYKELEK